MANKTFREAQSIHGRNPQVSFMTSMIYTFMFTKCCLLAFD